MIGFELIIKGETISASLLEGVVSVILTRVSNNGLESIDLDFTGLNTSNSDNTEIIECYKSNLEVGDEISIKVREIQNISTPIKVEKQSIESINSQNVNAYYNMKRDLEEKGLI